MNISIEAVKSFYDEAVYRKLHGFIYKNIRVEYAWRSLLNALTYTIPKQVLEIGCGMGEISCRLAERLPGARVTGFDISEQSILLASNLFISANLNFYRGDSIGELKTDSKYDIIFMMDVYEHIPVSSRPELHSYIREHIAENGLLFLSCPTPQHLDFLRLHAPAEIQPVDENISLDTLQMLSSASGLKLVQYKEVSVWRAGDYFHALFSNQFNMQPFSDYDNSEKRELADGIGIKKELEKKIKTVFNKPAKKNDSEENALDQKRELITSVLGKEILDRVESYGK